MTDQTPPAKKPPRSTIKDFQWVIYHAESELERRIDVARAQKLEPHPDLLRDKEIWEDLRALLLKLDICRASIAGVFRRRGIK